MSERRAPSRPLGLHQITARELDPLAFVRLAATAGYEQVSLFTNGPPVPLGAEGSRFVFPTVTRERLADVRACLADSGITVTGAEFFLIRPDTDPAAYDEGLAIGQALGAAHAVTHVFDTDRARAVDTLGAFCERAAMAQLVVGIEFCRMTPGCRSIAEAAWFVDQVGRPDIGFGICPLHLTRSGGTATDVAALDARYFVFGQINDGHGRHEASDYYGEVHDRALPGDGDFALHDMLSALPAALPIEVKIPSDSRVAAGVSALDFVRDAATRSRTLLAGSTPFR